MSQRCRLTQPLNRIGPTENTSSHTMGIAMNTYPQIIRRRISPLLGQEPGRRRTWPLVDTPTGGRIAYLAYCHRDGGRPAGDERQARPRRDDTPRLAALGHPELFQDSVGFRHDVVEQGLRIGHTREQGLQFNLE